MTDFIKAHKFTKAILLIMTANLISIQIHHIYRDFLRTTSS